MRSATRRLRLKTSYHSAYWANALTLQGPPGTVENLSCSMANARVDLNPHQVDVRLSQALDVATGELLADFTRQAVKRMKVREHRP